MAAKIFIDTDVIIDYLTDRSPFANFATILFELHEQNKLIIYVSAISINNVHYVARKLIGEKRAVDLIDSLIDNIEVVGTTKKENKFAIQTKFKDFEDAVQYANALTIKGLEAIVTRNIKDFKESKIAVFTPEIYLKTNFENI
jgi:predicted nucleic acid-binding protein